MYAVVNGGIDPALRTISCQFLSKLAFDGYAVGGSLGKTRDQMITMLSHTMPQLPEDKPNHLLGIGDLDSLQPCIQQGVDTFDSSHPTRCARHGLVFTSTGPKKITLSAHKDYFYPIDTSCTCYTCQHYTFAYLHHLFKAYELAGYTLASIHNLHFMVQLMKQYQQLIMDGAL